MSKNNNSCVLMFSGGRDSTLAAVRLSEQYSSLILVTVTSDHLTGIDAVKQRLEELKKHLPNKTKWMAVSQPTDLLTDTSFYQPTCLPCHHAYITVGLKIAEKIPTNHIALGYTGYQSTWPEQTENAVNRLSSLLGEKQINLILPVYDIKEKDVAIQKLKELELSSEALEQKCSQQIKNVELEVNALEIEIDQWAGAINNTLGAKDNVTLKVLEEITLNNF